MERVSFKINHHILPRFDDIWEPSEKDTPSVGDFNPDPVKIDITKEEVPPALLMKVQLNQTYLCLNFIKL